MITSVTMKNFKAFEDETLKLKPLNVLTGLNSSGKSSVIQALRMLNIQGLPPDMGTWKEFTRYDANSLELAFSRNKDDLFAFEMLLEYNRKEDKITYHNYSNNSFYYNNHFNALGFVSYISADRHGPKNILPLKVDGAALTVGERGEHIVSFLQSIDSFWIEEVETPKPLELNGKHLMHNISAWLNIISPGIKLQSEVIDKTDAGRIIWDDFRAAHVGFGLSYTLPIIASVLLHSAQKNAGKIPWSGDDCGLEKNVLLLIENPEAHLHPAGQTAMGRLMACAAACGVQIVVETHSDHLLNGMRIAVKEGILPHTDMGCLFFTLPKSENKIYRDATLVDDIQIDKFGMLTDWPTNFFDETEKNLLKLI
jgi:predicted ATPase